MATKYSDYVQIRESKPAYNIGREEAGEWETFIPNEQFNGILRKVISAVRNNDQDAHKSFWMDGTYGTGKSHAAAVIKHLLCDEVDNIRSYVEREFAGSQQELLRQSIYSLRETKRLFPVSLYGTESIAQKEDLSPRLQGAIKRALDHAGLTGLDVKTDFKDLIDHIKGDPKLWEDIISHNPQLEAYAQDSQALIEKLDKSDSHVLTLIRRALAERRLEIRLNSANICDWFFEVQDKLAATTPYCGLLIVWDEFTDLMRSDIGPSLLVELQKINERAMETCNNSYFFFISHPSALNRLDAQERTKTIGRYHYMKYNMEVVSAFKIMSRKLLIVDPDGYRELTSRFFGQHEGMLMRYAIDSNNVADTERDLTDLFPIHPATANLATYYAREVGSSSRSVFEFIGANEDVRNFLDSEERFAAHDVITADYLWDYVIEVFNEDHIRYGAVTERFNSYCQQVRQQGPESMMVFKGILLLNALNNVANNPSVTPSEENIKNLFEGTRIEPMIAEILNGFNENSIIQRAPGGLYSIQFSALPPREIEEAKAEMKVQYKLTSAVATYDSVAGFAFSLLTQKVNRPCRIVFFSQDINPNVLKSKIEKSYRSGKGYELFVAVLLGRDEDEVSALRSFAEEASREDERFANVAFMVFDTPFGNDNYERFIEYMANAQCAARHSLIDQRNAHVKNACEMVKEWMTALRRGNFTLYLKGESQAYSTMNLANRINEVVAPAIFNKGVETLDALRNHSPKTFWKVQHAGGTAKNVLSYNTREELLSKFNGPSSPLKYLFQDAVDENLKWKSDVDEKHPLRLISDFVDSKLKHAVKSREFNLAEMLAPLTEAPYGLFPSYAGIAMLAFAMRPWIGKLYGTDGKPQDKLCMYNHVLECFRAWESNRGSNKLVFTLETREAGELCKRLVRAFGLNKMPAYSDISSLRDARWAITREYAALKGYPLWALTYVEGVNDDLAKLIGDIVAITADVNANKNPALMGEANELLKRYDFELKALLNRKGIFEEGYHNFLKSDSHVRVTDDQLAAAHTYIRQHLAAEIGFWQEREVREKLKDWKLSIMPSPEPPVAPPAPVPSIDPADPDEPDDHRAYPPVPPVQPARLHEGDITRMQQAHAKIDRLDDLTQARRILTQLCDLGYETVIDTILHA